MQSMSWVTWILDLVFPPADRARTVRATTLDKLLSFMKPVPYKGGVALFPYRTSLMRALITEAKYKGNEDAQKLLGYALRDYLSEWIAEINAFDERPVALIPIPLSKKRFRERGYNQVTEIVRHALKQSDIELAPHLLSRVRDTRPQTTLHKTERKENMEGAFVASDLNPTYLYIVMDDVATTGATLEDAVRALQEAGAKAVVPLAIAY